MKYTSKPSILFIVLILVSTLLLMPSCDNIQIYNNTSGFDDCNFVSYYAKEKTEENHIIFSYPQFMNTFTNAAEINELIMGFVKSALQKVCNGEFRGNLRDSSELPERNNYEYTILAMDINYTIKRNDADYFSVIFEGLYNNKTAAHPVNYFNSFTIDVRNSVFVTLSDLYDIDADFMDIVKNEFKEQIRTGLAKKTGVSVDEIPESIKEFYPLLSDSELLQATRQADINSDFGFHSFMTDTALGISFPLEHAMGDHYEILIAYDMLDRIERKSTGDASPS